MSSQSQASNTTCAEVAKPGHGHEKVVRSILSVPVTQERKPYINDDLDGGLWHAGTPRANIAATHEKPQGTTDKGWNIKHAHKTVLQQHCDFFDTDHDGILWPLDTFRGFRALGINMFFSLLALFIIHINFSYPTSPTWLPDPFFRIYLYSIDRTKHGSDTGTYDNEGRFVPQKFEEIFTKYADGRDYVTVRDVVRMIHGQRCVSDIIGWGGMVFEWTATWIMLWPEDGRMMKEDIRRIYDGSIFYTIAERRESKAGV